MERAAETGKQHEPSTAGVGHGRDAAPAAASLSPVLQLQQQAGNQAVQQLLRSGFIEAKLAISNPDDPEEREADNVAHAIMRKAAGAPASSPCSCSHDGEMCEECQQKQSQPTISRRASAPSAPAHLPRIVGDVLRSPGHPLDSATRAFFEPRFGRDFSQVRIHTDSHAAESARSINAHAYTVGPHIAFNAGQYAPESTPGRTLLAHELVHTIQGEGSVKETSSASRHSSSNETDFSADSRVREARRTSEVIRRNGARSSAHDSPGSPTILRQNDAGGAPQAPPVDTQSVKDSVDIILKALKGITTSGDSAEILRQFDGKSPAFMRAILQELKSRAGQYDETPEGMVRWLFKDMTAEDRRNLRKLLMSNHVLEDLGTILVNELIDALGSLLDSSQNVMEILTQLSSADLDGILSRLETATKKSATATALYLFDEIDRVSADKLRTHFIEHGGPHAWAYVADFTAAKVHKLISGFLGIVSHSESTMVVNNFNALGSAALCQLTQQSLDVLTRASDGVAADERLFQKLDESDYNKLLGLPGLTLRTFTRTPSTTDSIASGAKWLLTYAEWTTCGVVGIATGILAAAWDILKGFWDIGKAIYHLLGCLVYLLSGFTVGSEHWLAVKDFFTGLGKIFKDPGAVWTQMWGQLKAEFETIEGPFADCKRAEFIVRKFIGVIVNILLIALAGYGLVKAGISALVDFAELAEEIGVIRALGQTLSKAGRATIKFVTAKAGEVTEVVQALARPIETLGKIRKQINAILLAVNNEGVYAVLRERAAGLLDNERKFWKENKDAWQNRGLTGQAKQTELEGQAGTIQNGLDDGEVPENKTKDVSQIDNQANSLKNDTDTLENEMKGDPESKPGGDKEAQGDKDVNKSPEGRENANVPDDETVDDPATQTEPQPEIPGKPNPGMGPADNPSPGWKDGQIPCFPKDTSISTPNGAQPIQNLHAGDEVFAYDFNLKCVVTTTVIDSFSGSTNCWVDLTFGSESLRATRRHPVWVESAKTWLEAANLTSGMTIRLQDGRTPQLDSVVLLPQQQSQETYNLNIDRVANFFAGESQVLVHNGKIPLDTPGYKNYFLREGGPTGRIYYNGLFGPDVTVADVRYRHSHNHDRFSEAGGDFFDLQPGTRTYGEARRFEHEGSVRFKTHTGRSTYRGNRQWPMDSKKFPEYYAKEAC
jgi:hypothetical protein